MNLILLNDISVGYSKVGDLYVKHHNLRDEARLHSMSESFLALAVKRKVKTEAECLKDAAKAGTWTQEDERKLKDTIMFRDRLSVNYHTAIEAQKKYLKEDLDKNTAKVLELENKKFNAIGRTAEQVSQHMANERFILSLFYRDEKLSSREVPDSEIEYLENSDIEKYLTLFMSFRDHTKDSNMKSLAASSYAQNLFYIAGSSTGLFGSTIVDSTVMQQHFLMYLKSYNNIISQVAGKVTPEQLSDFEFLDKWATASEKAREQLEKKNVGGGPTYESIRKAASKDTKGIEDHVRNMKSVLG